MKSDDILCRALRLAAEAHAGQVDKQGRPCVLHVLRVMLSPWLESDEERALAAVHDIKEDDPDYWDVAAAELPDTLLAAVDAISRGPSETYSAYIQRCGRHPLARRVKLADLDDNITRLDALPADEALRLGKRYRKAREVLLSMDADDQCPICPSGLTFPFPTECPE